MSKYRFEQIVFNSTKKKKPTEEDKYTYLGLEHLDPGSLHVTRFGSDVAPIGEKLIMTEGDVLFGKRRAYQKKVAIAPFDGIFSAHGMVLRPNEEVIDKSFFPLFISSDYFLDAAIKISVGSLSPTINWRDLKKLEFELPEMEEQRDLAKVLWAMDATKNSYQKLLLKTDELVKSRFVEMFGGLNREPLSKYIEQVRGVSYKPADLRTSAEDDAYTLLRANNIADGTVNFDEVQYVASRKVSAVQVICKGDILMCGSSGSLGHVGKAALCKPESYGMTFGAFCKVIRPAGGLLPVYIASYFQSDEYRKSIMQLASGSNINNLKAEHIDNLLIPVASSEMQEQFAEFVYQSDKSKFQLEQALAELTYTYKKIISKKLG
ncbi:TPA: restriction endonuclease subunit S [Bacillus cereus]|uniref:restriction endonuclease subunit S n=1 Tax=Bacillus cereus group sp. FL70 TaxID=3040254 RepID=UPI003304C398|nr:restriction endonuclease subunit S [Bacillus cereus]